MSNYIINKYKGWINYNGQKIGTLTVLGYTEDKKWECKCDCGNIVKVNSGALGPGGRTRSCGCKNVEKFIQRNTKHGMHKSSEYSILKGIVRRCYNKNEKAYPKYGGRGIKVCDRWLESFENFYQDMGKRPTNKHSVDRIDVDGDYTPENCRWADNITQNRNKRYNFKVNYKGENRLLIDLCEELGIPYNKTYNRIHILKWDVDKAVETPIKKKGLEVLYKGEKVILHDICREKNLEYLRVHKRIYSSKWDVDRAIDTPTKKKNAYLKNNENRQ